MQFTQEMLAKERPDTIRSVSLPRRERYHPSPADWRDEVLCFLLVDRFSDGREAERPPLDRNNRQAARPSRPDGSPWRWDRWAESGAQRWQGGTLAGLKSKLAYLKDLGVTTLWISPVFKQRGHLDTFHGYGIQDFLEVDPRFGSRQELVDLVAGAHDQGLRVILDIIFNHTGFNWVYPGGAVTPSYKPPPGGYFVRGLPGVQFALPEGVERLRAVRDEPPDGDEAADLVIVNACDPANLYGPALDQIDPDRPQDSPLTAAGEPLTFSRIPSTWLVQQRGLPVLLAEDTGASLTTIQGAGEGLTGRALHALLDHLAAFERRVTVKRWNGEPVLKAVDRSVLEAVGFYRDYPGMTWEGRRE